MPNPPTPPPPDPDLDHDLIEPEEPEDPDLLHELPGIPHPWDRALARLTIGALAGLVVVAFCHPNASAANKIPWYWMIVGPLTGAILALLIPLPSYAIGILIRQHDLVLLTSRGKRLSLPPTDVALIACAGGLSLEGGELVIPRFLRLWTTRGFFSIRFENNEAVPAFNLLANTCPHAILLPYHGKPTIPARPRDASAETWRNLVESTLSCEFRQQARGSRSAGLLGLILGAAALTIGILAIPSAAAQSAGNGGPKLVVFGIMVTAGGVAFLIRSFVIARRGCRAMAIAMSPPDEGANLDDAADSPRARPGLGTILLCSIGLVIGATVLIFALIVMGVI